MTNFLATNIELGVPVIGLAVAGHGSGVDTSGGSDVQGGTRMTPCASVVRIPLSQPHAIATFSNCHEIHHALMSCFPKADNGAPARSFFGLLYASDPHPSEITDHVTLTVQALHPPSWERLPFPATVSPIPAPAAVVSTLSQGDTVRFLLRANPTKHAPNTRRCDKHIGLLDADAQLSWLRRRFATCGGRLLDATATLEPPVQGWCALGALFTPVLLTSVLFRGVVAVEDPAVLADAVSSGLGPGKAYGFGLLRCQS